MMARSHALGFAGLWITAAAACAVADDGAQDAAPNVDASPDATKPVDAASGPDVSTNDAKAADAPVDAPADSHEASAPDTGVADGAVAACLPDPPPVNCPDCKTQNLSDHPVCELYLTCYRNNDCDPNTSCGTNPSGVCGVNTIGGGSAPQSAAITTYDCACGDGGV